MKNIKTFSKYFEELSPGTYDKVIDAGIKRNDPRGSKIANTADSLKFRPYENDIINYKIDGYDEVKKLPIGEFPKKAGKDFLSVGPIHITKDHNGGIEVINSNGKELLFDRKSSGILAKMLADLTEINMKPNDLKQF